MNRIYFNPRSREGSDRSILNTTLHNIISIHAPAKGATHGRYACHLRQIISIHAPAKGATHHSAQDCPIYRNFNPRSREGSDPDLLDLVQRINISIHAPAKGAPPRLAPLSRTVVYFNPRSREGSDRSIVMALSFLPHISLHAPVKGATLVRAVLLVALHISIHAPVKGATLDFSPVHITSEISIHAPVKGATLQICSSTTSQAFQSTLP